MCVCRDAFLVLMADVIADVGRYVVPPTLTVEGSGAYRTFKEEFMTEVGAFSILTKSLF